MRNFLPDLKREVKGIISPKPKETSAQAKEKLELGLRRANEVTDTRVQVLNARDVAMRIAERAAERAALSPDQQALMRAIDTYQARIDDEQKQTYLLKQGGNAVNENQMKSRIDGYRLQQSILEDKLVEATRQAELEKQFSPRKKAA